MAWIIDVGSPLSNFDLIGYEPVGAEFCRRRRSWSRGDHVRHRDLQGKSKPELGVLQQDPPMLKSVLCFNRNGVLE